MTCPRCQGELEARTYGHVTAHRCAGCSGLFLDRAALGALVEAENDWHANQSANTAALPRITDQTPKPTVQRNRSFVEALFNA